MDTRREGIGQRWYGLIVIVAALSAVVVLMVARSTPAHRPLPTVACPPAPPDAARMVSTHPGVHQVLAPPGAVAVDVCEYENRFEPANVTYSAVPLPPGQVETGTVLADLSATFDVPVVTPPPCYGGSVEGPETLFRFRYADAPDVSVFMSYGSICAAGGRGLGFTATNGTITGYFYEGSAGNVLFEFNGPRA